MDGFYYYQLIENSYSGKKIVVVGNTDADLVYPFRKETIFKYELRWVMRSQLSTFHLPIFGEERGHKREAVVYGIFLYFPISGEEDRGIAQLLVGGCMY